MYLIRFQISSFFCSFSSTSHLVFLSKSTTIPCFLYIFVELFHAWEKYTAHYLSPQHWVQMKHILYLLVCTCLLHFLFNTVQPTNPSIPREIFFYPELPKWANLWCLEFMFLLYNDFFHIWNWQHQWDNTLGFPRHWKLSMTS